MRPPPRLPGSYLVLETTNRCSLSCVHCSVSERGHPHHARTGFLAPELAEALYEDLARVGARFDALILFWLGEPLIHPQWSRIYRQAVRWSVEAGIFGKVELHTNATHLDARARRAALNDAAVPQVWHFSLDAARRDTYRRIKQRDRFEEVEAHVAAFLHEKGRLGARWPRPVMQFIVSDRNADEAAAFRDRWEASCRRAGLPVRVAFQDVPPGDDAVIFFKQLDCPTAEEQARQNAVFRRLARAMGQPLARAHKGAERVVPGPAGSVVACSGFWKSPVIGWNGEVTVCTRDNLFENRVGNLREAPFSALWWGPEMRSRRERVARGDYRGLPPCGTCFIPCSSNYTDISPEEIRLHRAFEAA